MQMDVIVHVFWLPMFKDFVIFHFLQFFWKIWLDFALSTQLPTTSASQLQNAVLVLKDMRIKELWYEWWQRTECALVVIFCISSCFHSHLRKTGFNWEKTFFPKFLHFA